ncbi:MAG TPA: hypothetical protein PKM25_14700, partial [Candidatus Ozemobacteraceae bacterium]|nr:hypothetical protein [Candidatus Ozemobacteraceae bacterium]
MRLSLSLKKHSLLPWLIAGLFIFSPAILAPGGSPGYTLSACDDTLLALLTSNDPTSEFSQGIRNFNRSLTLLGGSLKEKKSDELPARLEKVMESWLAFSNKFNVNPPDEARQDTAWAAKMSEAAERIGRIRKLTQDQKIGEAHDQVLALSGRLGMFFEAVGMSELKRRFLAGSEMVTRLEQDRVAGRYESMKSTCASLTGWLSEFRPSLTGDAIPPFERSRNTVSALRIELGGNPA